MKTTWLKVVIAYLTIVSFSASCLFLFHISRIMYYFNIPAILMMIVFLFVTISNISYLIRKNNIRDTNLILIYNTVFSLIAGLVLRIKGYAFADDLGVNLSVGYLQNYAGHTFIFNFNPFNLFINFPDRILDTPGFHIEINLIMWGIAIFLIIYYKRLNKVKKLAVNAI